MAGPSPSAVFADAIVRIEPRSFLGREEMPGIVSPVESILILNGCKPRLLLIGIRRNALRSPCGLPSSFVFR